MATKYKVKLNPSKIKRQFRGGKTVAEIARQAGFPKNCGQNRIRGLLMRTGIYKAR